MLMNFDNSLLYIDGCSEYLGCTVQISGPDLDELKKIKVAFKEMLRLARFIFVEGEYHTFIGSDLPSQIINDGMRTFSDVKINQDQRDSEKSRGLSKSRA